MDLVDRVKNILVSPKEEWPKIAAEASTTQGLYLSYIAILAAIGPLVMLVALGGFEWWLGLRAAVAAYVNSLIGVAVLALIVDLLAPNFGGTKDFGAALKLVAYSLTAVWVAYVAVLVPVLGWLIVLVAAIYAFYLFFLGAPVLKKCASDKAVPFTIVVLLCTIVLMYLVRMVIYSMGFGLGMGGMGRMGP